MGEHTCEARLRHINGNVVRQEISFDKIAVQEAGAVLVEANPDVVERRARRHRVDTVAIVTGNDGGEAARDGAGDKVPDDSVGALQRDIIQHPHAPGGGVAAFMSAHSKTPNITPWYGFFRW